MFPNLFVLFTGLLYSLQVFAPASDLEQELKRESIHLLADAVRKDGNLERGAILFYQPQFSCISCHTVSEEGTPLGPILTSYPDTVTETFLIESLLYPSRKIREGYETITVVTGQGKVIRGILHREEPGEFILRDATQAHRLMVIDKQEVEEYFLESSSLMPQGLVNQFTARQQFLDLVKYLMEIAKGGIERAEALRPPGAMSIPRTLPEYEQALDHKGFITEWNNRSLERGEEIYQRWCANCHGDQNRPGSLPTSRRLGTEVYKRGSDPFSIYQTLTHGWGLMPPLTQLVPEEKYDVIHYVREVFIKEGNPRQYTQLDGAYLDSLPDGKQRGPEPSDFEPWSAMNYGPYLSATYEIGDDATNFAYKGIAVCLDSETGGVARGKHWMIFDQDTLRMAAIWSGEGFIDWQGINFNGAHEIHPRVKGRVHFENSMEPGWAEPGSRSFEDPRIRGRDGLHYGPLPSDWGRYQGLYLFGTQVIFSYRVGQAHILEMPYLEQEGAVPVFARKFHINSTEQQTIMQVMENRKCDRLVRRIDKERISWFVFGKSSDSSDPEVLESELYEQVVVGIVSRQMDAFRWESPEQGKLRLVIDSSEQSRSFTLLLFGVNNADAVSDTIQSLSPRSVDLDLESLTKGGPARWPDALTTEKSDGSNETAFAVDVLKRPSENPWFCRMRLTGLDFFQDNERMAVCTWDGDVWLVRDSGGTAREITWKRIASGLFQPLGLKIVEGQIYVGCRDQIVRLHDLNGDEEIDYYENFNNDHQVTEHFHEFAMGLQTDSQGNFYYAKSARHAKKAVVPHHGTLLRVSRDGLRTQIMATGFRAANGVCINPDGTFFVTDQEGHWTPKNRINQVREGGFYGNMWGYHDVVDSDDRNMEQPLCWITNSFERSPSELLWVDSDRWGPLRGSLLSFSYGYGHVFVVPHEQIGNQVQGGLVRLPIPAFPTGIIRGRFHPQQGQLYVCGMHAWAGNQQQPGGLYRIRYTGKPVYVPLEVKASEQTMALTFSGRIHPEAVQNRNAVSVKTWSLRRTENYGSDHYRQQSLEVSKITLSRDRKTLFIHLPELRPTWCMEIRYQLLSEERERVSGTLHNTIHQIEKSR